MEETAAAKALRLEQIGTLRKRKTRVAGAESRTGEVGAEMGEAGGR